MSDVSTGAQQLQLLSAAARQRNRGRIDAGLADDFADTYIEFPSPRLIRNWIQTLSVPSGLLAGETMTVFPWQRDILEGLYGNRRKVRRAVISVARKNGKTAFTAAIALAHLCGPLWEPGGEIIVAASDKNQAGHLYRVVEMYITLAGSGPDFRFNRTSKTIEHIASRSRLVVVSSDAGRQHGHNASLVVCDEVAQWKGRELYEVLSTAGGARKHPMLIVISTQSPDPNSLMSELVDYAGSEQGLANPAFHGVIHSAPDTECPLDDRDAWAAANPGLGTIRSLSELEDMAREALDIPSRAHSFRNLYLNQRVAADAGFLPVHFWLALKGYPARTGPCYVGMDLASVTDLAALAVYWPETGAVDAWGWIGQRTLEQAGRLPVQAWLDDGLLICDGEAISKRSVAAFLAQLGAEYDVRGIAYDRWGMHDFEAAVEAEGVYIPKMLPFGQGYRDMSPAIAEFERVIVNGDLVHDGNPLLTWTFQNLATDTDAAGNRKFTKSRAADRIDPIIALVMAIGSASRTSAPVYDFSDAVVVL